MSIDLNCVIFRHKTNYNTQFACYAHLLWRPPALYQGAYLQPQGLKVIHSFFENRIVFRLLLLSLADKKSQRDVNRRIRRPIVVGITVVVHIAHVRGVVRRNGGQPPVAAKNYTANNFLFLSLSDFLHFLISISQSLKRFIIFSIFSILTVSTHSIILTSLFCNCQQFAIAFC